MGSIALISLLAFLAHDLTKIGWGQVWHALPVSPLFYLSLLPPFFLQPLADLLIYRNLLGVGRRLPFFVLLRKRSLNGIVLEYSGEAYFFLWARKNLGLEDDRILLHAVKDSNVLSAGAGLVMIWLMLLAVGVAGGVDTTALLGASPRTVGWVGSLPLVLCLALFIGGRRVTAMPRPRMFATFAVHLIRGVIALSLDFASLWLSGALPSALLCLEFVAFRLLITRVPMLPNKDLVFLGLGITAAGAMDLSAPRVTAALVVIAAFGQMLDVVAVGVPWMIGHFRSRASAEKPSS